MRRAGDVDRLQPLVAADAVLGMDDEIARRQAGRLGDELIDVAAAARRAREPVAENVLLAEQQQVVGGEALFERQQGEADGALRRKLRERGGVGDAAQFGDAVLAQHGGEPVGRAFAIGGDRGAAAGFLLGGEIVAHRVEQVDAGVGALGGEIFRRAGAGVEGVGVALIGRANGESCTTARPATRLRPIRLAEKHPVGLDRAVQRRGAAGMRR